MSASEFPSGDVLSIAMWRQIQDNSCLGDAIYYNVIRLETTEPGFTNVWDPHAQLDNQSVAFYWPYNHPLLETDYNAISFGATDPQILGQRSMEMKRAIMGASIGEAALADTADMQDYWNNVATDYGSLIGHAMQLCERSAIPLGLCFVDTVVQSELIPRGEKALSLCYVKTAHPRSVLEKISNAVKARIEAEKQITGQQNIE